MGPTDSQAEASTKALEQALLRDPMECRWGYFHYCDGPPAAGGGVGCFAWFPSREDMLEFIAAHQAAMCPGQPGFRADKAADMVRFLVGELGEAGAESLREALNRVLAGSSQIEWWGRFDDLATGGGEFPGGVRAWYREQGSVAADSSPVPEGEAGLRGRAGRLRAVGARHGRPRRRWERLGVGNTRVGKTRGGGKTQRLPLRAGPCDKKKPRRHRRAWARKAAVRGRMGCWTNKSGRPRTPPPKWRKLLPQTKQK